MKTICLETGCSGWLHWCCLPSCSWPPQVQAAAWEPTKPVEFIVPAGAGGASDQMARTIQGIIMKYKLMKPPVMIFNKGGASGAEGAMEVKEAKADPHKLLVAFSLIYTLPIAQNLPLGWEQLQSGGNDRFG